MEALVAPEVKTENFDVTRVRSRFPVLARELYPGVPLIYMDSAATSQKPEDVIQAMSSFYKLQNANIHRGIHKLAEEATSSYEAARVRISSFVGAGNPREIVFTRNTTESINLVAYSWGRSNLKSGDRVLLTEMEHHSNIVPWHILAEERGIQLDFVPVTDDGKLDLDAYSQLLERKPRLVGFTHMSNMLGTINPVKQMTVEAHAAGALVLVDGAQSVPHLPVNLVDLGVDFYAFSAHKMCGPTGIGLTEYALERLEEVAGIMVYGPSPAEKGGVMSFTFEGVHPHDVAQVLDRDGIAVRAGHHCAMPLHEKFQIPATTRASFYVYNTTDEIDTLIEGLYKVKKLFG
jgi:cysteine desulfurase/selenocysteine lyase